MAIHYGCIQQFYFYSTYLNHGLDDDKVFLSLRTRYKLVFINIILKNYDTHAMYKSTAGLMVFVVDLSVTLI